MVAPKGNQFWKARSSHGRKPIFPNPEKLWKACCEYFEWIEDNPLMAAETVKYQGVASLTEVPKMRVMTISGLCLFLDISHEAWIQYRHRQDFIEVCSTVENIIYNQKFAGAAADLLNPSIIARDLGLVDKKDIDMTSKGEKLNTNSDTEIARTLAFLLRKGIEDDKKGEDREDNLEDDGR